jgi:predicted branched-subunit amino acid permease
MSNKPGRSEFLAGVKAEVPILVGVLPFGLIYGVLAIDAGLSPFQAQAMSFIVFYPAVGVLAWPTYLPMRPTPSLSTTISATLRRQTNTGISSAPAWPSGPPGK